jgi:mycofactocin system creatininase family protein
MTMLSGRRWPELGTRPLVLVPAGSTEQHGPHLPLSTDSVIATAVAEHAARTLGGGALVAPALAYGASGEHEGFAGTVSIGHEALAAVLVELVRSLSRWAGRIVIVNGHGGNLPTVASAVVRMVGEGHDVAWVPCAVPPGFTLAGMTYRPDAHAGRTETSLMLHLAPELVALDRAWAGNTAPMVELLPGLRRDGVSTLAPNGVLGDPAGASGGEGAALLAAMVDAVVRGVRSGAADARGRLYNAVPHEATMSVAARAPVPASRS